MLIIVTVDSNRLLFAGLVRSIYLVLQSCVPDAVTVTEDALGRVRMLIAFTLAIELCNVTLSIFQLYRDHLTFLSGSILCILDCVK
jgi:hypothetical protein